MEMILSQSQLSIGPLLGFLDLLGIAVFAISGCLVAAKKGMTFVTFAFFALVTGVGGGTLRDLLIDAPVFWVHDPSVLTVICVVVFLVWFTPQRWWEGRMLDWFDAIGIATYAVYGAAKAVDAGIAPLPAFVMGVTTACVGGIIRDVLANEPSILIRPELYVTAAALASSLYIILVALGVEGAIAGALGALAGFALRGVAIYYRICLPGYRESSRKDRENIG